MSKRTCKQIHYIDASKKEASLILGSHLSEMLEGFALSPVFLCIGSDRVTGDSLGPMIGSWLKNRYYKKLPVYGTLELPVHALNLDETMEQIHKMHRGHPIIAIDASLGTREHQGYITVGKGSICPGAGVNKALSEVGDLFITGIVGVSGRFSHLSLQTARLSWIISIAEQIAGGIQYACTPYAPEDDRHSRFTYAAPCKTAASEQDSSAAYAANLISDYLM